MHNLDSCYLPETDRSCIRALVSTLAGSQHGYLGPIVGQWLGDVIPGLEACWAFFDDGSSSTTCRWPWPTPIGLTVANKELSEYTQRLAMRPGKFCFAPTLANTNE